MPIFEFACADGHEFQLWDDAARLCPTCGSEYLKRIFKTPPMVNTAKTPFIDTLIRTELENRGITNIKGGGHEGETEKVTYKSTEAQLKAEKIERDFPILKDKTALQAAHEAAQMKWGNMTAAGVIKSRLPGNDLIKELIPTGTTTDQRTGKMVVTPNLTGPNQFALHDRQMVQRIQRKDPQNLQVKR